MQKKWLSAILLTCAFTVGVFSQGKEQQPLASHGSPALEKLAAWAGQWKIEGQAKETPYSHAGSISSNATCAWSAGHGYMICDQQIKEARGDSNALSIYAYNEDDKTYKLFWIDRSSEPRLIPLSVEGNIWTYGGRTFEDNGRKIQIRTLNEFLSPREVKFWTEYSDDNGSHWTLMNEGKDTKVN